MIVPPITETEPRKIVQAIRDLATGAANSVGSTSIVLSPGAVYTTVSDPICTNTSMIVLSPLTQNAATAVVWVSAVGSGTFTLGHDASAATDRTFNYEIRRP